MSIWGPKITENDDAADWLSDFEESPTFSRLQKAILKITNAKTSKYLDVDIGAEAIAAADMLAKTKFPKVKPNDLKKLVDLTLKAVTRVSTDQKNSEIRQSYSENKKWLKSWIKEIKNLEQRLKKVDYKKKAVTLVPQKGKRTKVNLGDIVAIPLGAGKFAYAKIYKDHDFGVYKFVSKKIEPVEEVLKYKIAFYDSAADKPVKSGEWPIIGQQPFENEDDAWAPAMAGGIFFGDPGVGVLNIQHKGAVLRPASPKEAWGMDIRSFNHRPELFVAEIVDRLIKGNGRKYRVAHGVIYR